MTDDSVLAAGIAALTASAPSDPGPPWLTKPWGRFRELFRDRQAVIVEAEIVAGGYSSIHKHLRKDNTFLVLAGELVIELYPSTMRPDTHTVTPDDGGVTVLACVPHRFKALQATRLLEIYRACGGCEIDSGGDDIVRMSEGGVRA